MRGLAERGVLVRAGGALGRAGRAAGHGRHAGRERALRRGARCRWSDALEAESRCGSAAPASRSCSAGARCCASLGLDVPVRDVDLVLRPEDREAFEAAVGEWLVSVSTEPGEIMRSEWVATLDVDGVEVEGLGGLAMAGVGALPFRAAGSVRGGGGRGGASRSARCGGRSTAPTSRSGRSCSSRCSLSASRSARRASRRAPTTRPTTQLCITRFVSGAEPSLRTRSASIARSTRLRAHSVTLAGAS